MPESNKQIVISFDQALLLSCVYAWSIHKPHSELIIKIMNSLMLIVTKLLNLDTRFQFFEHDGHILSGYADKLYKLKIQENLMLKNDALEYELTDMGKIIVEQIKRGRLSGSIVDGYSFDRSIREKYTIELSQNLNGHVSELSELTDQHIVEVALSMLR